MSFNTTDYTFAVIPFGSAAETNHEHDLEWYLDDPLIESGKLPPLNSAPLSSWIIARLRVVDDSIPAEITEHNDGGGYCFEMAVAAAESVLATFQLQGNMEGVAALGRATDGETAERILQQFVELLTEAPNELGECCYTIVDPEWMMDPDCFLPTPDEDSQNEYGWRDGSYLGVYNIRED